MMIETEIKEFNRKFEEAVWADGAAERKRQITYRLRNGEIVWNPLLTVAEIEILEGNDAEAQAEVMANWQKRQRW